MSEKQAFVEMGVIHLLLSWGGKLSDRVGPNVLVRAGNKGLKLDGQNKWKRVWPTIKLIQYIIMLDFGWPF